MLEFTAEPPCLYPLSPYKSGEPQLGVDFLPKHMLSVMDVEVMRARRLTKSYIETIQFIVPRTDAKVGTRRVRSALAHAPLTLSRVQRAYFQDDLYRDTRITWQPALSGDAWFAGTAAAPATISLRPANAPLRTSASVRRGAAAGAPAKMRSVRPAAPAGAQCPRHRRRRRRRASSASTTRRRRRRRNSSGIES